MTAIAAFAVWHAAFDISIDRGMRAYVEARTRFVRGAGPEVTIRRSMADARRRGNYIGLLGAGVVVAAAALAGRARQSRLDGRQRVQ